LALVGSNSRAATINYSGTIVTYTAPTPGTYNIVAAGAQGGSSGPGTPGGLGAIISGDVFLTAGTILDIVVGGMPTRACSRGGCLDGGGGGGGGTFVFEPFAI